MWRKMSPKVHLWRKNDKYQVCVREKRTFISTELLIKILDHVIGSCSQGVYNATKRRIMNCENDSPQIGDRNMVVTDLCLLDLGVGRGATICQKENLLRKK